MENKLRVEGKGWVKTEKLEAGDILNTVQGKQLAVEKVYKNHEKVNRLQFQREMVEKLGRKYYPSDDELL